MSRFTWMENDLDDDWALQHGRWIAKTNKVLKGNPGRAALQDLERVLLAIPHKRLIEGTLCATGSAVAVYDKDSLTNLQGRECGMCVVGAWVYRRWGDEGMTPRDAWKKLKSIGQDQWSASSYDDDGYEAFERTLDVGVAELGITRTLAQIVSYENDGIYSLRSPEQRYAYVLDFVRRALRGLVSYA